MSVGVLGAEGVPEKGAWEALQSSEHKDEHHFRFDLKLKTLVQWQYID